MQDRRNFVLGMIGAGATMAWPASATPITERPMQVRRIPVDGAVLPVLGLGTWSRFGDDPSSRDVLDLFARAGGTVVDSSPMYGDAEAAVGRVASALGIDDHLFLASKVWTSGRDAGQAQIKASIEHMGRIDLMQIHNLLDWRTHITTLRRLKAEGVIRYIGLTHYQDSAHGELESLIAQLAPDFIQINLSIAGRHAEKRLLPAAIDAGVAVLINRPFEEGALFRSVSGQALPEIAAQHGIGSWAQLFLAFVMSHPAVTSVLAATKKLQHMQDNLVAARLPMLSPTDREALHTAWRRVAR